MARVFAGTVNLVPMASAAHIKELKALALLRKLRENGFFAYFAGGCVRDRMLGVVPKDYDVATDARPEIVQSLFDHTVAVGAAFGSIMVCSTATSSKSRPSAPMRPTLTGAGPPPSASAR